MQHAVQAVAYMTHGGLCVREIEGNYQFAIFSKKTMGNSFLWDEGKSLDNGVGDRIIKLLNRWIPGILKHGDRTVFMFIADRTFGFGKKVEKIETRHFIKGLFNATDGSGLTKPTILASIRNLQAMDFITKNSENQYTININSVNEYMINAGKGAMSLREAKPKKGKIILREESEKEDYSQIFLPPTKETNSLIKETTNTGDKPPVLSEQSNKSNKKFLEDIDHTVNMVINKPRDNNKKTIVINANTVGERWKQAVAQYHPGKYAMPLRKKEYGMLKNFVNAKLLPDEQVFEFIDYCVKNWVLITKDTSKILTNMKYDNIPSVENFVRLKNVFGKAFAQRQEYEQKAKIKTTLEYQVQQIKDQKSELATQAVRLDNERRKIQKEKFVLLEERRKAKIQTPVVTPVTEETTSAVSPIPQPFKPTTKPRRTDYTIDEVPKTLQEAAQFFITESRGSMQEKTFNAFVENFGLEGAIADHIRFLNEGK